MKEMDEMALALLELRNHHYLQGYHLVDQPFIPQYLGFDEEELRDNEDILIARIYSKDGFNIAKNLKTPQWAIRNDKGEKFMLIIRNMYEAFVILRACGMDISVEEYVLSGIKEQSPEKELPRGIT